VTWYLKARIMKPEEKVLVTLRLFKHVMTATNTQAKEIVDADADSQTAWRSHKSPFFVK
jgi:hypothetical protein